MDMQVTKIRRRTPTRKDLLEATWKRLEREVAEHSFIYEGEPTVALRIARRHFKTKLPREFQVSLWSPGTLLRFLRDGGTPSVWLRKTDYYKQPMLTYSCRVPDQEAAQQFLVLRYVAGCENNERADFLGHALDVRDHMVRKDPRPSHKTPKMSPSEMLQSRDAYGLWPSYDLTSALVHPGLLDLSEDGDVHMVRL